MRGLITVNGLLFVVIMIVVIHGSIISDNTRTRELTNGLSNAMDYSFDKLMDYYRDVQFTSYYNRDSDKIITDIMSKFCEGLQKELVSDAFLEVDLIYIDLDRGTFQVRVTEYFDYSYGKKNGSIVHEKTYALV